jgi:Zn-dependent protease
MLAIVVDKQAVIELLMLVPPFLLSLTIHEFAHARTALAFGDPTARNMGRCSLNPLVHLDPMGTLCLIIARFGWAKPVPVNPHNLVPRKMGSIAVSLAGPLSNLMLAVVTSLLLRVWFTLDGKISATAYDLGRVVLWQTAAVNVLLCVFNLVPLFPLDGHHILREILPGDRQGAYMHWQVRYGQVLLLVLIFGPRLLRMLSPQSNIPSPLGWVYRHIGDLIFKILFSF